MEVFDVHVKVYIFFLIFYLICYINNVTMGIFSVFCRFLIKAAFGYKSGLKAQKCVQKSWRQRLWTKGKKYKSQSENPLISHV